jgi:protein-disulfide isomerase
VKGPADALVTIVESSDFECPYCKQVAPTLAQVEEAYRGKVRFVFKHNPLSIHKRAAPAAALAEEARAQGGDARFWLAAERLMAAGSLDDRALEGVAKELHLDVARVKGAIDSNRYAERFRRDQKVLARMEARGTPTFFINGRKLMGAVPFAAFKTLIDEELAKAQDLVSHGVPASEVYARIIERGSSDPVRIPRPSSPTAPAPAPAAPREVQVAIRSDDPARGAKDAKVTVVEFSDFQCPYCSRAVPVVKELEQDFKGEVRIVWKHLPLPFHSSAMPAAIAAEAARQQGKFWEMHDRLFAGQQALSGDAYTRSARELGLDLARFDAAVKDPATRSRVEEDTKAAAALGVSGTPTFVVNGEPVVGAGALKDAVRRHLEKARSKG